MATFRVKRPQRDHAKSPLKPPEIRETIKDVLDVSNVRNEHMKSNGCDKEDDDLCKRQTDKRRFKNREMFLGHPKTCTFVQSIIFV